MKKKMIASLILIVIILVFTLPVTLAETTTSDTVFYCKDMQEGIIALKEVSSFKMTLSNGYIFSTAVAKTETAVNIEENMKNVEFVLILDASGSMSGTRNEITKQATQELTDALFNKIGAKHLKMGTIFFASSIIETLPLTSNKESIKQNLSQLPANGGTRMSSSLQMAREWLTGTSSEDTIKIICTLSDGAIADSDQAKTRSAFEAIHAAGISTMSIFVETSIGSPFSGLPQKYHKNFTTTTVGLSETIATDIYNEIYFRIILMMEPKTTYNISNAAILNGDKIVITADEEIIHGATLNPNQKLLTENKTNNDYNWKYNESERTIILNSGSINLQATKPYKVKLVLSTLITPELLSHSAKVKNCAEFKLRKTNGYVVSLKENIAEDPDEKRIKALDILMIPPTGNYFTAVQEKTAWISTMVTTGVAILLIIVCVKKQKQS